MRAVLGIDRKIKRAWLDALLDHLTQTTDHEELRRFLDERLAEELPGHSSRAKSVGIALKIWSGIPANRVPLRDRAIALLPTISGQERVWLHWGMTSLAYPFFRDAAEVVGPLLPLQDNFTSCPGPGASPEEVGRSGNDQGGSSEVIAYSGRLGGHAIDKDKRALPPGSQDVESFIGTPALALGITPGSQFGRGSRSPATSPLAGDVPVPAFDRSFRPPQTRRLPSPSSGTRYGYGLGTGPKTLAAAEALEELRERKPKPAVQAPTLFENGAGKYQESDSATAIAPSES